MFIIFSVLMTFLFFKLFVFSAKAAWTMTKLVLLLVFLPIFAVVFLAAGIIYVAIPLIIIGGLISLVKAIA